MFFSDIFVVGTTPSFFAFLFMGIIIGSIGVLFGGTMFLSLPLFQLLIPGVSSGSIIGNIKVGSFFRGIGSTLATWKIIHWKENFVLSLILSLGAIFGVSVIAQIDQKWIFPMVCMAIILTESAPFFTKFFASQKTFFASVFLVGIYQGVLGAGISVFLLALLRIKEPDETQITRLRIQANYIEWFTTFVVVIASFFYNTLIFSVFLPWSMGSLLGGYLGSFLLHSFGKFSGKTQMYFLRFSFLVAIITSGITFYSH